MPTEGRGCNSSRPKTKTDVVVGHTECMRAKALTIAAPKGQIIAEGDPSGVPPTWGAPTKQSSPKRYARSMAIALHQGGSSRWAASPPPHPRAAASRPPQECGRLLASSDLRKREGIPQRASDQGYQQDPPLS